MCIRDRSRTFYSRYTEYKKRVAHAKAGGAIQREVVSIAEIIPSHVQKVFARVYHESRTITPKQLEVAPRVTITRNVTDGVPILAKNTFPTLQTLRQGLRTDVTHASG